MRWKIAVSEITLSLSKSPPPTYPLSVGPPARLLMHRAPELLHFLKNSTAYQISLLMKIFPDEKFFLAWGFLSESYWHFINVGKMVEPCWDTQAWEVQPALSRCLPWAEELLWLQPANVFSSPSSLSCTVLHELLNCWLFFFLSFNWIAIFFC